MTAAVSAGVPAADVTGARILGEIARMRGWPPAGSGARADELTRRIEATLSLEDTLNPEGTLRPEASPGPAGAPGSAASPGPEAGPGPAGDAR
jgi:hypothetical protein